jgi:cysteine-rich repeat protein
MRFPSMWVVVCLAVTTTLQVFAPGPAHAGHRYDLMHSEDLTAAEGLIGPGECRAMTLALFEGDEAINDWTDFKITVRVSGPEGAGFTVTILPFDESDNPLTEADTGISGALLSPDLVMLSSTFSTIDTLPDLRQTGSFGSLRITGCNSHLLGSAQVESIRLYKKDYVEDFSTSVTAQDPGVVSYLGHPALEIDSGGRVLVGTLSFDTAVDINTWTELEIKATAAAGAEAQLGLELELELENGTLIETGGEETIGSDYQEVSLGVIPFTSDPNSIGAVTAARIYAYKAGVEPLYLRQLRLYHREVVAPVFPVGVLWYFSGAAHDCIGDTVLPLEQCPVFNLEMQALMDDISAHSANTIYIANLAGVSYLTDYFTAAVSAAADKGLYVIGQMAGPSYLRTYSYPKGSGCDTECECPECPDCNYCIMNHYADTTLPSINNFFNSPLVSKPSPRDLQNILAWTGYEEPSDIAQEISLLHAYRTVLNTHDPYHPQLTSYKYNDLDAAKADRDSSSVDGYFPDFVGSALYYYKALSGDCLPLDPDYVMKGKAGVTGVEDVLADYAEFARTTRRPFVYIGQGSARIARNPDHYLNWENMEKAYDKEGSEYLVCLKYFPPPNAMYLQFWEAVVHGAKGFLVYHYATNITSDDNFEIPMPEQQLPEYQTYRTVWDELGDCWYEAEPLLPLFAAWNIEPGSLTSEGIIKHSTFRAGEHRFYTVVNTRIGYQTDPDPEAVLGCDGDGNLRNWTPLELYQQGPFTLYLDSGQGSVWDVLSGQEYPVSISPEGPFISGSIPPGRGIVLWQGTAAGLLDLQDEYGIPQVACGDGITGSTEQCDSGTSLLGWSPDQCRPGCRWPTCGDGTADSFEECDDRNFIDNDGCTSWCAHELCGDGVVQTVRGEVCDDANAINGDGCDADCLGEQWCGDGVLQPLRGETCDDGLLNNNDHLPDACRTTCELAHCGDGVLDSGEECDDHNLFDGDHCAADCTWRFPSCGKGILDFDKACDPGQGDGVVYRGVPPGGCTPSCELAPEAHEFPRVWINTLDDNNQNPIPEDLSCTVSLPDPRCTFESATVRGEIRYLGRSEWELEIEFHCTDCAPDRRISRLLFPSFFNQRYLLGGCNGEPGDPCELGCDTGQVCDGHGRCVDSCLEEYRFYTPELLGSSEAATMRNQDKGAQRFAVYPHLTAPLVIMANDTHAAMVAATNWPPRQVMTGYHAQRIYLNYSDLKGFMPSERKQVWKAGSSQGTPLRGETRRYRALLFETSVPAGSDIKPWHLAADRYREWLSGKLSFTYPTWMQQAQGIQQVSLMNITDPQLAGGFVQDRVDRDKDVLPWVLLWGAMSDYGGGCCTSRYGIAGRYFYGMGQYTSGPGAGTNRTLVDLVEQWTAEGMHVGYYTSPHLIEKRLGDLSTREGVQWLSGWQAVHRQSFAANTHYVDVLGRSYIYGDVADIMRLFTTSTVPHPRYGRPLRGDVITEGHIDVYPTAGLMDGSMGGMRKDERDCSVAVRFPDSQPDAGCDPRHRQTMPELVTYLLPDRVLSLGSANNENPYWTEQWHHIGLRTAFLLGLRVGVAHPELYDFRWILHLREAVHWADSPDDLPRFVDTIGLHDVAPGVRAKRFETTSGRVIVTIDNYQGAGGSFTVNGPNGATTLELQQSPTMCAAELRPGVAEAIYCCFVDTMGGLAPAVFSCQH